MPVFEITSPDGKTFEVTVPEGATQDQVLAYAQSQFAAKTPAKKEAAPDPTEGMSTFDKFRAGVGKSMVDAAQGLGQMVGLVDRADVAESRRLNAPLMNTTAGKVGDIFGNVATTIPLAFVPGANTLKGAALIGAATGLAQPSTSTGETARNVGFGGAAGAGGIAAGRTLGAGYQLATGMMRPLTQSGQRQIAAEVLQASATDAANAAKMAGRARSLVPGSNPTLAQATNDPGLAQLERTLYNNPEAQGPLARVYRDQTAARKAALADIAGTPEHRAGILEGRKIFAKQDYEHAMAKGIDKEMAAALQPQIESLMRRPSIASAKQTAQELAAERDIALTNFGSLEGLDWLKKGLDNQISAATSGASSIGKDKLRSMIQTKDDLMSVIEQIAPGYKVANDNFAAMSKQINASDVANDLQQRLYKNAEWGSGKELGSTYQSELTKALDSIKKQTGQDRALADVMPQSDIRTLENIARDLASKENAQSAGRATGSPTVQNMMGQNLLNRVAGPLGLPSSLGQSVIASHLARPYDMIMGAARPNILGTLSEAAANPKIAAELLRQAQTPSRAVVTGGALERFLMTPGLITLESGE